MRIPADKQSVKKLPRLPGVYKFEDNEGKVIYVGKAKNLLNRVSSYFAQNLEPKTSQMVSLANTISYIPVENEFEALLLEAKLVKKFTPKYNIQLRDDKSPLYIGITKEELPRIILLRQKELMNIKLRDVFGPFVNTSAPKWVLRKIRKVFPYTTHKAMARPCVYHQIGLCSPCPSEIRNEMDTNKKAELKREFMLNVRRVKAVLSGKSKTIIKVLENEMRQAIKSENFEIAQQKKNQIEILNFTMSRQELNDEYLKNPNLLEDIRARELINLKNYISKYYPLKTLRRIECYDIAHFQGAYPTASMVTFIDGEPDKTFYRHFRMHNKNSDVDNMKEVLKRRKKYFNKAKSVGNSKKNWGKPDLIIVDGGKGQLSAATEIIQEVPIVGLAKREETLVFKMGDEFYEMKLPESPAKKLVQRIRDEAHRFARLYHHKLVSRAIKEA